MNGNQQTGRQGVSASHICNLGGPPCPECGGQLMRIGLCFTCIACGWGGCG